MCLAAAHQPNGAARRGRGRSCQEKPTAARRFYKPVQGVGVNRPVPRPLLDLGRCMTAAVMLTLQHAAVSVLCPFCLFFCDLFS